MTDWTSYELRIADFAVYPDAGQGTDLELCYLGLGLASEAGEVAGLVKKEIRDSPEYDPEKWKGELGDVVWYLTRLCTFFGFTLQELMDHNCAKLQSRKERDVLGGHGDNR